ncbi:MAG: glycoside hydrolase 43 family protein [Armatimonadota bacterium]|nr:glycoside hydrolase 43 family protein [Armatimonadota bacterium]
MSTGLYPWIPDQGDGTYRNPIILADYSDPDVERHGDDFYLIASSFNCTPGLPILHSRDLVNWTIINHAIQNVPHPRYREVQHGCGVWAPAIRFHDGRFWIFFPTPDEGIYVTTAENPAGQWSEPHLVQEGLGLIDPCPLWDDDGQAYLVYAYAGSRAGIKNRLRVSPMAPDASRLLDEGHIVYHEPERHPTLEGPKFLKKDGWYYILAPAGGVENGWQVVFRSRHIYGPYEEKIVLAQGKTSVNGPHQGGLIDLPNGEWWFIHFQELQPYGRIIHLQPVEWQDGWPLMGINRNDEGVGEPVLHYRKPNVGRDYPSAIPQTNDEFDSAKLGLQWQWHANHEDNWHSLSARQGHLRLFSQHVAESNLHQAPNLLMQKFPARGFTVETALEFTPRQSGEQAGLVVMGHEWAALSLWHSEQGNQIVFQINGEEKFVEDVPFDAVRLRLEVQDGGLCTFSYAPPEGEFVVMDDKFQATEGHWIGAKVGIYSLIPNPQAPAGYADFSYFRFAGCEASEGESQ